MVYITGVKVSSPGTKASHITSVMWLTDADGKSGRLNIADTISFIEKGNVVKVAGPTGPGLVKVVNATPKYIRTNEDATTKDNLLSLPRFD